jgi:F-type H+-transporting ATPase subunit b
MASNEQEDHTTSTGMPGGGQGETTFPPFDAVNFTPMLIWLSLSFGLFYLLMSKIALPRVESILHTRAHKITNDIAEANAFRAQSEEAAAAHDKTIGEAKAKALAVAQETRARLTAETEANRLALEAELNARLAASETQILAMKAAAMGNVEAIASEAAAAIVRRITGKPAGQEAQEAIARAIATIKA